KGESPVAPSAIPSPIYREMPRELTLAEIEEVTEEFARGAALCKEADIDGVEISCSAGYLLSEFFSPLTNKRTDAYGGSFEKRCKFPLEVMEKVRLAVGKNYPVVLRVSAEDMLGGYDVADTIQLVQNGEKWLDAVNVTGGWHESPVPQISMQLAEGGFAYLAKKVKDAVNIPVIGCNRINNGEIAQGLIEGGYCDFVGCARAFVVDPNFANKVREGKSYRRCIACNQGCIERVLKGKPLTCIFNPKVGLEYEAEIKELTKASKPKKVLIIGGGPAGMEAAIHLKNKGHMVRICTKEQELGGALYYAAKAPYKQTINENVRAMAQELTALNVEICLGVEVDAQYISKYHPGKVILAVGSKPVVPTIPGLKTERVIFNKDILDGSPVYLEKIRKSPIIILGGGPVGLEMASFLATETTDITVLELGKQVGKALGGDRKIILKQLAEKQVRILTEAETLKVKKNALLVKTPEGEVELPYSTLVVAMGYMPQGEELFQWLISNSFDVKVIGDSRQVGGIGEAIVSGWEVS
ncbi:MAG: FAD-dependent oxidoreductase, partial [Anaerovorax sp.]